MAARLVPNELVAVTSQSYSVSGVRKDTTVTKLPELLGTFLVYVCVCMSVFVYVHLCVCGCKSACMRECVFNKTAMYINIHVHVHVDLN